MSRGQVIIITGASTGLGFDAARALASAGHRVYAAMRALAGRNRERGEAQRAFAREQSVALEPIDMDVTSTASVTAAVGHVLDREGRVDVVINNAAIMPLGLAESYSAEQFAHVLDTNVVGYLRVDQAVLPAMRAQRSGLLIHMSSLVGRQVLPFVTLYGASKYAVEALAEGLRYEVSQLGVESIVVEPGPFTTNLLATAPPPERPEIKDGYGPIHDLLGGVEQGFAAMFSGQVEGTEPDIMAEALIRLVDMPPGTRPLRSVVGSDIGVRAANEALEPHRVATLTNMGFIPLDTVRAG